MNYNHRVIRLDTHLETSSPYYFGDGIVADFPRQLKQHEFDRCFLITSEKLLKLFGNDLLSAMQHDAVACEPVVINDTELDKDWDTLRLLCENLTARGATKDSILIAMGGGVIGNVVGLAAALIFRGIGFVEVPTTVTGQTDSTLSNKQAINGARGKNQFGVYYAPLFIWTDAAYSRSEPHRQQKTGLVEGIKNILISHDRLDAADAMLDMWENGDRWSELLLAIVQSKFAIIKKDPTERGYGLVLEYGHTFGHAIEWLSGGRLLHGEAVSIGMCLAAELSHSLGFLSSQLLADHYRLLRDRLGTPTELPHWISPQAVYEAMFADNKRTRRGLRFMLLRACGQFVDPDGDLMTAVDEQKVLTCLKAHQASSTGSVPAHSASSGQAIASSSGQLKPRPAAAPAEQRL